MNPCQRHRIATWTFQIIAAAILLQTLFFKFTSAEESVSIFTGLWAEPWGRIGSGIAQLIAAGLLLSGRFSVHGAGMAMGVMAGAIGSHFTNLGIVVQDDGGLLFALACTVFLSSALVVWLRRSEIALIGGRFSAVDCGAKVRHF